MRFKPHLAQLNDPSGPSPRQTLQKDRQFVTALARGLEVLRCFEPGECLLGNQEIARRTGLPKPTVSRLTHTLTRLGYLGYAERVGKYQLGTAVLSLGYAALSNSDIRDVARPLMQELAEHANAAVALGARDRLSLVYLENCRSSATRTLSLDVGARIPIATTAMGRAFLCALPERERTFLFDHLRRRDTAAWPQLKAGIEQAQAEYERVGFCLSVGEWQPDVNAVAAPLIAPDGSVLAFNCGGPGYALQRDALESDIGPRLVQLVSKLRAQAA